MGGAELSRTDRFAELLAEGLTIAQIRREMALTRGQAQGIMSRIRRELGPQAR